MARDATRIMTTKESHMAMVTLVEAARLTGLAALARAIRSCRLSPNRKEDGSYEIDPSGTGASVPVPGRSGGAPRYNVADAEVRCRTSGAEESLIKCPGRHA